MIRYLVSKKAMIIAGEASGELYGSLLSRELKAKWPDIKIFGIGGPKMEEEGVSLIAHTTHVLGITEVIGNLIKIRKTFKAAVDTLKAERPDVIILIDYPDFNIALARKAKKLNIPILYYVSPQVWAWRSGRTRKIASLVNRMAVLFPFEVDYYKNTGLECEFVGHPLCETIDLNASAGHLKQRLGISPDSKVVSLLPGSRPGEIKQHLDLMIRVGEKLHREFPEIHIIMPLASGTVLHGAVPDFIQVIYNNTFGAVACSEAAAVASGTAALETALALTPMVVYYRISPVTYLIGRLLTNIRYISLVNILSGREVVRELLQSDANPDNIYNELKSIVLDTPYRQQMKDALNLIRQMMKDKRPSARVAGIAAEIAGWKRDNVSV